MAAPVGLVIVGASLAGLRAAEAARESGFTGPVTLIGEEAHLPYDRPPLSKAYLDVADELPDVVFRDEQQLRQELGIDLLLGTPAVALDTRAQTLTVGSREVAYSALVIATGSRARTMRQDLAGVHTLRTLDDAIAVRAALDAGAKTVVIGAGFIGSEVASAARRRGLQATIVEALPTPLVRAIGPAMGQALSALHTANGTDLRTGVGVEAFEGTGRVTGVRLVDGTVIPAELVVVGIGADPNTAWLDGSGLALDNGVVADEFLRSSAPGVYAAGDVVRWLNPLFGTHLRIEHWTNAAEQGARAALNALDPANAVAYETVPYFWSDWYDSRIQFVGVTAADEVTVVGGSVEEHKFVALYRQGDRLTGALTLNRRADIMRYRMQIAKRGSWDEALAFAESREKALAAKA